MGYAKYQEDDIKITDHRKFMQKGSSFNVKDPVRYFDCKYCGASFTKQDTLFLHIKNAHNIVRPLIVVNGKVAGGYCIIHHLASAFIDLFGYNESITINGHTLQLQSGDEIDITKDLDQAFQQAPICEIAFGSVTTRIELIERPIEADPIITSVIETWEHEVAEGRRPSAYPLNRLIGGDRLFLDGIYNYYVACQAQKDKARRYDDAMSMLSRFNTLGHSGQCVLKIIAYRRNWIDRLSVLVSEGAKDIFSVAVDYYQRRPSDLTELSTEQQIYIEEQTQMSLDLVLLFQKHEYGTLGQQLSNIEIDELNDPNLVDQLNLFSARLAVIEGDHRQAEMYYEKLITPAFIDEFKQYKAGLVQFEI